MNIALRRRGILDGVGESVEARDRPQILLAVSATEHLLGEDLVQAHARRRDRDLRVVHTVDEGDEPEGLGLVGELVDIAQADEREPVDQTDVPRRVHRGEMADDVGEEIIGCRRAGGGDARRVCCVVVDDRLTVEGSLTEVDAVDAQRLEAVGHRADGS